MQESNVVAFEKALEQDHRKRYDLRLFITGSTPKSIRAVRNIKQICEEHLGGRYELEVIDVYQQPGRARDDDIIATPTLVRMSPLPLKKFIGDLSDAEHVLLRLDIVSRTRNSSSAGQEERI